MNLKLKHKSDLHLLRKLWHTSGVVGLFLVWVIFNFPMSFYFYLALWLLFVPGDVVRVYIPKYNAFFNKLFSPILRASEANRLAGTTYLLSSVLFISFIFPHKIVSMSLLFLAFADPIASFVGIKWGKHKIFGHKSVEGFVAAFTVCFMVTYFYLKPDEISTLVLLCLAIFAGLCGALAELIPLGKMDDNFTMPILSSVSIYFLFMIFNIQL